MGCTSSTESEPDEMATEVTILSDATSMNSANV